MHCDKVRIGVIGVGRMGERHCRVYSNLRGVELVAVSDPSIQRGKAIAEKYGIRWYEHYSDLLGQVDAVSIVTPTQLHLPIAAECLRRGIHVLVEKPMVADLDEANELATLARGSSVVLQVGHIERFNPAFIELQSVLEDLEIVAISARRLSPFDTSNTDVDVIYDLMLHDIDLAVTLLGDGLECIQAQGQFPLTSSADYAVATLSTKGGPIATMIASRVTEQKVRLLEVTALGAYVEADLLNKSICIHRRTRPEYLANHQRPVRYRQESLVERIHIPTAEPLLLELEDFARCVRSGEKPKVSCEDGLRVMELATRIGERMRALNGTNGIAPGHRIGDPRSHLLAARAADAQHDGSEVNGTAALWEAPNTQVQLESVQ